MFRKFFILMLAMGIVMLSTSAAFAQQTIVYVDAASTNVAAPSFSNPGSTWSTPGSNAYAYLQNGVKRAGQLLLDDPDTPIQVWVRAGIYRVDQGDVPSLPDARTHTLRLREKVRICGGFAGTESALEFNRRNPITNVTVITGDLLNDDVAGDPSTIDDNSYHIITAITVNATAIIDGFTVTRGNAIGAPMPDPNPNPHLNNAEVGGGMFILGAHNQVPADACLPTILRCRFEINRAKRGGGVFMATNQQSSPLFSNCVFLGNNALLKGGGFYQLTNVALAGNPTFANCLFVLNRAEGSAQDPGDGGAFASGLYGAAHFRNCTIANNFGEFGGTGGIHQDDACGGISRGGLIGLDNCIVWDNTNAQLAGENNVAYSNVQVVDGSDGICLASGGNLNSDPLFVGSGSWRLQSNSPCIDSGINGEAATDAYDINQNNDVGDKAPDLDGRERLAGAEPPSGSDCGTVDRGAYEFAAPYCAADIASASGPGGDGLVNIDDLLAVVGAWGACPDPDNCLADIVPLAQCGNDEVDIDDLLFVISNWGTCPGIVPPPGGVGDIPDEFYDCYDACSQKPDFGACMDDCFKALCELGHTQYCE